MNAYDSPLAQTQSAALRDKQADSKEQYQSFSMNGSSANLKALNALLATIRVLVVVAVSSAFAP